MRHRWHIQGFLLLCALTACAGTESLPSHNLLEGKILAVAHGAGGFETYRNPIPPNTVAAVERSLAQGADGIELDVQLSADGQLVVFHDGLLDRATACAGCIRDHTWEDLQDCRYQTRNGDLDGCHRLPLLDTLLAQVAASGREVVVFLNTKHDSPCDPQGGTDTAFAQAMVEAIHRQGGQGRMIVESMQVDFLLAVRALDPTVALLFDDEDYVRGMDMVRQHQFLGLAISNAQVTADQVRQAHAEGYWLGIWGVRVLGDARKAVEKGPEFVMTDDLLLVQAARKE